MRTIRVATLAIAGTVALSTSAMATTAQPLAAVTTPPPLPVAAGFDWAGPYLGVYGGRSANFDPIDWNIWILGGQAGYNLLFGGRFLAGAEIGFGYSKDEGDNEVEGALTGRVGAIVGERFLSYAEIGVWMEDNFNNYFLSIGGGVEVGMGAAFSLFAEAAWLDFIGIANPDLNRLLIKAGVNWHPGN